MKAKEYGSDFETFIPNIEEISITDFFADSVLFTFSGRVALYCLIKQGIDKFNWERIYLPTYYCHEVYQFIEDLDIEKIYYSCSPNSTVFQQQNILDNNRTVILCVDYFGVNKLLVNHFKEVVVIEDLTHNLSAIANSTADFCFGSLRKVLPIGVGGFISAKKQTHLPLIRHSSFSDMVAYKKMAGMYLKKDYLTVENSAVMKDLFRAQLMEAEELFSDKRTVSSLPSFVEAEIRNINIADLIKKKKDNLIFAKSIINKNEQFQLFTTNLNNDFALIIQLEDSAIKAQLKAHLVLNNIYPMVLWPNQSGNDIVFENKSLFIHVDFRYSFDDIEYIINNINTFFCNA